MFCATFILGRITKIFSRSFIYTMSDTFCFLNNIFHDFWLYARNSYFAIDACRCYQDFCFEIFYFIRVLQFTYLLGVWIKVRSSLASITKTVKTSRPGWRFKFWMFRRLSNWRHRRLLQLAASLGPVPALVSIATDAVFEHIERGLASLAPAPTFLFQVGH